jgi:hypothetical protein
VSQKLGDGNSRGADILDVMRRKFETDRCLRGYDLRLILFYILTWKIIQDVFLC